MIDEKSTSDNGGAGMPRREFVKKTSLLAVGGAITEFPFVITARAEPDDPIRVGVIGCGGRGTGAALNILGAQTRVVYPRTGYHTEDALPNARIQVKNVKVVALADAFRDRLDHCREQLQKVGNTVAEEYCFTGFDGYKQVIEASDVVLIANAAKFHPFHAMAALRAGKHVFVEKPLCGDEAEIARLLNLIDRSGLAGAVGHVERFNPAVEAVRADSRQLAGCAVNAVDLPGDLIHGVRDGIEVAGAGITGIDCQPSNFRVDQAAKQIALLIAQVQGYQLGVVPGLLGGSIESTKGNERC